MKVFGLLKRLCGYEIPVDCTLHMEGAEFKFLRDSSRIRIVRTTQDGESRVTLDGRVYNPMGGHTVELIYYNYIKERMQREAESNPTQQQARQEAISSQ